MTLEKVVAYFNEAEQNTIVSRDESELHRDYYDGKQLTQTEIAKLEDRNQPPVVDNKVKDKVDTLLGREVATRTDPKAFPRTPADEKTAQAATDSIRFVADNNNLDQVKSEVGNNLFVEGTGVSSVTFNTETEEIEVKHIMWDRFFYDPHSRKKDFSDAKFLGEAIWLDIDDAKSKYPAHTEDFDNSMFEASSQYGETYADKPLAKWVDHNRKRVRIVEIYHLEKNTWMRALYSRHALIEEEKSAYQGEFDPEHPYTARSAYVDREGHRYGVIRRYKDLQDEHNKRRSKLLHLGSSRTIVADAGAVDNIAQAREEIHKPDGWITKNPGKTVDILTNDVEMQVQRDLLLYTDKMLSDTGPNEAIQGLSGRISGRAKQIDQQAGELVIAPLYDGLRDWQLRTYRKIWSRVRQFWTEEKWIRVRDDERNMVFVPLNKPMTQQDAFDKAEAEGLNPPPPPFPQAPLLDNNGQQVMQNEIGRMDIDIILEQAPDMATIQQEQFDKLADLAKAGLNIPEEVIIEASALRNKRQILQIMKGETPEAKAQAQIQQMFTELEKRLKVLETMQAEADVIKTKAETEVELAKADELETQANLNEVEAVNVALGKEKAG